jgi:acyl-CoA hydrolase
MTQMVMPNDTNILGNLMGGNLLYWMDIVGAISAGRHSNRTCVTASVDSVSFHSPIKLGELVILEARVTRAFTSSMEVFISVYAENIVTGEKRHCNDAFLTFVAIDQAGRPIPVNKIDPETPTDIELYTSAEERRENRLKLTGKVSRLVSTQ